jgi:hypothetical protein
MKQTAIDEKNSEEVEWSAFRQNCDDTLSRLQRELKELADGIEEQDAIRSGAVSAIEKLESEIATIEAQVSDWKANAAAATDVRNTEKADFRAASKDYSESLSALDRAILYLESKSANVPAAEFVQTVQELNKKESLGNKSAVAVTAAVTSFLQAPVQGATSAYVSAMGGVIDMLRDLQTKFSAEKKALVDAETASQQAFELLLETSKNSVANGEREIQRKQINKAKQATKKGSAEQEMAELEADQKATKTLKKDTTIDCKTNNKLYEKQDNLRQGEIDAIAEAVEILGGDSVAGAGKRHLTQHAEIQEEKKVLSFLQVREVSNSLEQSWDTSGAKERVLDILLQSGSKDKFLASLASRIENMQGSGKGPFDKVLVMIRNLVSKLSDQAVAEAAAHGQCEADKATGKLDVEDKQNQYDEISAEKEGLDAKKARLEEDVAKLSDQLANLSRDKTAATQLRQKNHKENTFAIKEAKEAQVAVANAIAVLKEFYAAGSASAEEDEGNELNKTDVYGGQQDKASGVLHILDVINSDFAYLETEKTDIEATQSAAYKELMNADEVTVATKQTNLDMKKKSLAQTSKSLTQAVEDLKATSEGLDAARDALALTIKKCDTGVTYEERVAQREKEIQAMKEALEVLGTYSSTK